MEDTAKLVTVRQFAMGEAIPEWLLTLEPRSKTSRREHFRFAVDVDMIETTEVFVVVPRVFGNYGTMIDMMGTSDCDMFAPGKPVRFASTLMDVFARGAMPPVPLMPGQFQEMPSQEIDANKELREAHFAARAREATPWWRRVWEALKAS